MQTTAILTDITSYFTVPLRPVHLLPADPCQKHQPSETASRRLSRSACSECCPQPRASAHQRRPYQWLRSSPSSRCWRAWSWAGPSRRDSAVEQCTRDAARQCHADSNPEHVGPSVTAISSWAPATVTRLLLDSVTTAATTPPKPGSQYAQVHLQVPTEHVEPAGSASRRRPCVLYRVPRQG